MVQQSSRPFGHHVVRDGASYYFDTPTSSLLEIDDVLAGVLRVIGTSEERAKLTSLEDQFGRDAVRRAYSEIQTAQADEGLFLAARPAVMSNCRDCLQWARYDRELTHLTMTLTDQCNLRCRYCLHSSGRSWIRPHRNKALSEEDARKALNYFAARCADSPFPSVSFYGGEPLLEFGLIRSLVTEARSCADWPKLRFVIDTNGTLLSEEIAEFVVSHEIHLQISLDGPAEIHDRYRRARSGAASHHAVLRGLGAVLSVDPGAAKRISFVATVAPPYDFLTIARYFDRFPPYERFGIPDPPVVTMNPVDREGLDLGSIGGARIDTEAELRRQFQVGWQWARKYYLRDRGGDETVEPSPTLRRHFDQDIVKFHHRPRGALAGALCPGGNCQPGQRRLHVRSDGALQPCERVGDSLVIGDVDRGIDRAAVEGLYCAFNRAVKGRCEECWSFRMCHLCFTALAPDWSTSAGGRVEIPERLCDAVRAKSEAAIRLFLDLKEQGRDALDFLAGTKMY